MHSLHQGYKTVKGTDHWQWRQFINSFLEHYEVVQYFVEITVMTDEANLWDLGLDLENPNEVIKFK